MVYTTTAILNLATTAADGFVDTTQVTYVILAAVGVSFGIWMVRRTLKLGR